MGASSPLFFYGTLCHADLAKVVLGREHQASEAVLEGHAAFWAKDAAYPVILPQPGGKVQGYLLEDIEPNARARVDFYESVFGYKLQDFTVLTAHGEVQAQAYMPQDQIAAGAEWNLQTWAEIWGATAIEAAREVMALIEERSSNDILRRYPQILVRAASRVRAKEAGPTALRREASPDDVSIARWTQPYAHFFAVEEMDMQFRRFDGQMSPQINRAVFVSGDAATVLPYDPVRDRVLLIEQFRAGPYGRGDAEPWSLEPIAGRVDPDETPQEAARREAVEEAGLTLSELISIASYYPSPGAKTEYLYSYLGLVDLPDSLAGGIGGVEGEAEDIRTHLVSFDQLMDLIQTGEVENGPLLISAMFLARERSRLRSRA